jgi:hypothetical protein
LGFPSGVFLIVESDTKLPPQQNRLLGHFAEGGVLYLTRMKTVSLDLQPLQTSATFSQYHVYATKNLTSDLALRVISIFEGLQDDQNRIFCSWGNCYWSTKTLKDTFKERNITVKRCYAGGLGLHYFLEVGETDPKLIIDCTYRQFCIESARKSLPIALIAEAEGIQQFFSANNHKMLDKYSDLTPNEFFLLKYGH